MNSNLSMLPIVYVPPLVRNLQSRFIFAIYSIWSTVYTLAKTPVFWKLLIWIIAIPMSSDVDYTWWGPLNFWLWSHVCAI